MVWNSDRFGRNDFLGEVVIPLGYFSFESQTPSWHKLKDRVGSSLQQFALHCFLASLESLISGFSSRFFVSMNSMSFVCRL